MTLSDRLSEIFKDTKHRAVSLRQLTFLFIASHCSSEFSTTNSTCSSRCCL